MNRSKYILFIKKTLHEHLKKNKSFLNLLKKKEMGKSIEIPRINNQFIESQNYLLLS